MTNLRSLTLEGTPYERGVRHGEAFAEEIETNAAFYYRYFADNGVDEETARNHARRYLGDVREAYPTYAEEIEGVADGGDIPIEEVTMITMRHTILYSAYVAADREDAPPDPVETEGCTSYGVEPEATANGHTYVGQNWDWKAPLGLFVMDLRREEDPNALVVTEAGNVLGKFGLNEHGIGFAVNGLSTAADGEHPFRKPSHVRGREIIDAERFDRAIGAIVSEERPTSRNYLLGHADGEVVNIETTPESCYFLHPEDDILAHANHFEHDAAVADSRFERDTPDTVYRADRLRTLLSGDDDVDETTIRSALQDHFGHPRSVCRHNVEGDDEFESHTNASLIMDLDERRMLVTDGPPCENDFQEYRVHGS